MEELEYWPFVDWVEAGSEGAAGSKRACHLHSLMYAAGLQTAARLNEITDRKYMAIEYEKRAKDILQVMKIPAGMMQTAVPSVRIQQIQPA